MVRTLRSAESESTEEHQAVSQLDYMTDMIRELRDMATTKRWTLLSAALEVSRLAAEQERITLVARKLPAQS